jgi:hypothetical protein
MESLYGWWDWLMSRSITDVWVPMMMQAEIGKDLLKDPVTTWVEIMGRLKPDVSAAQANAALRVESKRHADGSMVRDFIPLMIFC